MFDSTPDWETIAALAGPIYDPETEEIEGVAVVFVQELRDKTNQAATSVYLGGKKYSEGYDRIFGNQN